MEKTKILIKNSRVKKILNKNCIKIENENDEGWEPYNENERWENNNNNYNGDIINK
jgi:hypothetical protein